MPPRIALPTRAGVIVFLAPTLLALVFGCSMNGDSAGGMATPSSPWNQALVTAAAATFKTTMSGLYDSAMQEPAFAGERSAYGETLDNLRVLREESSALHAKLADGKTREETVSTWERIKEVTRDTQESSSWSMLPPDFSATAQTALGSTGPLDAFYGTP